jgi:glucose/arabinose dehydrogenase/mono/diheme cytochrome c family protein
MEDGMTVFAGMRRALTYAFCLGGVSLASLAAQALAADDAKDVMNSIMNAKISIPSVQEVFDKNCAGCHGSDMQGGIGPSLVDDVWIHGSTDADLLQTISKGVPEKGMPSFGSYLSDAERHALVALIHEKKAGAGLAFGARGASFPDTIQTASGERYRFENVVAAGLVTPWSMVFIAPDRMLVTERPGRLRIVNINGTIGAPLKDVPVITNEFHYGGFLGLALHPDFRKNGYVYLAYTDEMADRYGLVKACGGRVECYDKASQIKIIRFRIGKDRIVDKKVIWSAPPDAYRVSSNFGGRIAFGSDGMLYFTVGDRIYPPTEAQDIDTPNGKIHRVTPDGGIPSDNPFVHVAGADPSIWTYGHRNPQGLAADPRSGSMWATEHGPRGGDELNLLRRGGNYGWPMVTYGIGYDGRPYDPAYPVGHAQAPIDLPPLKRHPDPKAFIEPVTHWTPSIAVSSIAFYQGVQFPSWNGSLLVGSLRQQELLRLTLSQGKVTREDRIFQGYGNIRDIAIGKDGAIYLAMNMPDAVLRMKRADK